MRYVLTLVILLFAGMANAQSYKLEGNEVVFEQQVSFKTGSSELTSEGTQALSGVKKYLEDKSYISLLRIEGHCFGTANDQSLSEKRAAAVGKWLTNNGIDCKRLIMVGFGNTKPSKEAGDPTNTRIAFVNAELRGKAIGGMPLDGGGQVAKDRCE